MNDTAEEHERSFPKGLAAYLRTRLQLLSIESAEALTHLKEKLLPVLLILICAISAYLLILTALVSYLGKVLHSIANHPLLDWELAALLVAGFHIGIIFQMKKKLEEKTTGPLFEYSRAELERDREWIQENKSVNPTSKSS